MGLLTGCCRPVLRVGVVVPNRVVGLAQLFVLDMMVC